MKIKMRDGVALDCHRYGKGQPVVLVHGFGGIQEIWGIPTDCRTSSGNGLGAGPA